MPLAPRRLTRPGHAVHTAAAQRPGRLCSQGAQAGPTLFAPLEVITLPRMLRTGGNEGGHPVLCMPGALGTAKNDFGPQLEVPPPPSSFNLVAWNTSVMQTYRGAAVVTVPGGAGRRICGGELRPAWVRRVPPTCA